MGDKDRGSGGNINLSIDDYYVAFLEDHPEINASGEFRRRLDELIEQKGWTWSEEEEEEDSSPQAGEGNTSAGDSGSTGEPQSAAQTHE